MKYVNMKFSAISPSGSGSLVAYPPYEESIDGIKKLIDEANARAKEKDITKAHGLSAKRFTVYAAARMEPLRAASTM